jgi:hypothetical protein
MYRVISLFLLFAVHTIHSEETTMIITSDDYSLSTLPASYPQVFIFDDGGNLVHRKIGTERGLKQAFKNTATIQNADVTKGKLLMLFNEEPRFSDYDFTLIFITDYDENDFCPPCADQNKINKVVIKSLEGKNIHLVTIRRKELNSRTLTIL